MAEINGNDVYMTVGGTAVSGIVSADFNETMSTGESRVAGRAHTVALPGKITATFEVDLEVDPSDAGQTALALGSSVAVVLYPAGNGTGNPSISFTAFATERGFTGMGQDGPVTRRVPMAVSSAVTHGTVT